MRLSPRVPTFAHSGCLCVGVPRPAQATRAMPAPEGHTPHVLLSTATTASLATVAAVLMIAIRRRHGKLSGLGRGALPPLTGVEAADPADLRLSTSGLEELAERFATKYIASGLLPGAVLAVVRHGRLALLREWGGHSIESVFKLYSVSKVFTSLAALQLVEEGSLGLDDAVSDRVPEWPARPSVEAEDGSLRPSTVTLRLRHCLTHTSGGTYELATVHPRAAQRPSERRRLAARRGGRRGPPDLRGYVEALAEQPLLFEPGSHFNYGGLGSCLLARAVEETSGLSIAEFMRRRLFEPAGMRSSGFVIDESLKDKCLPVEVHPWAVPAVAAGMPCASWAQWLEVRRLCARGWLATLLRRPSVRRQAAGLGVLSPKPLWDQSLKMFHPDAGVVASGADVVRWLAMLTRQGLAVDSKGRSTRVLGPGALAAIAEPATPELQAPFALDAPALAGQLYAASEYRRASLWPWSGEPPGRPQNSLPGQRFGLGGCVLAEPSKAGLPESCKGSWHWMGFGSTYFFVNPREELAACFLTQLISHRTYPIHHELLEGVHGCLS